MAGAMLANAGLTSLDKLLATEPRRLEAIVGRGYGAAPLKSFSFVM